jgi:sugar O-acyltransferase (sialic acid O-acetyltransferase NeuD family)
MNKSKNLIIVGGSAFAEIAFEYFTHDTEYEVVAFSVEAPYITRDSLCGLPVVPFESLEGRYEPGRHEVFAAVGYTQLNRLRARLSGQAKEKGYRLASYVSPRAFVWRDVLMGEHCFIFENNVLQPFVKLGNNVVLWSGNHIGHHSTVGDNCFVSSHVVVSGFCEIGENSFLGVNSTISNNVKVGHDNWVSPGVAILKDTSAGALFRSAKVAPSAVTTWEYFNVEGRPCAGKS